MTSDGLLVVQNIRILYKIALVTVALALLGIATIGLSIYRMGQADERNSVVLTQDAPALVWVVRADATVNRTLGLLHQMIAETDVSDIKATQEALRTAIRDFDTRIGEAGRLLPQCSAEIGRIKADYARLIEASREAQALAVENTTEANNRATLIVGKTLRPAFEALRREITAEIDHQVEGLKATPDGLTATCQSTRNSLLLILGLGVVIVAGAAMLIAQRGIAAPLQGLAKVMEVLARGDYSAEVQGQQRQDEVGLMARAVEVFKQNGIEGKRLAAAAEEARIREEQRQRDEEARQAEVQRDTEEAERQAERLRREARLKLATDSSVRFAPADLAGPAAGRSGLSAGRLRGPCPGQDAQHLVGQDLIGHRFEAVLEGVAHRIGCDLLAVFAFGRIDDPGAHGASWSAAGRAAGFKLETQVAAQGSMVTAKLHTAAHGSMRRIS
jgi:methyl-accepting chemotaxis protein